VGTEADAIAAARLWQFMPVARHLLAEPDPRVIQRYAEENAAPEMAVRSFMVSTDPGDHADRLMALQAAGATDVFIHAPQPHQRRVIDFYASSVLPLVRQPPSILSTVGPV
jgi:alkanesulfonate monooxygenase SsuD/methylene tetrahydromethanopterin reductase-like flavin-dependent oxidoreductase (luciferase family)